MASRCHNNQIKWVYYRETRFFWKKTALCADNVGSRGGTPILGHTRDVRPEWVNFAGRKPADGCKFLTKNLRMGVNFWPKNLRMGHNFDIIYLGMGDFPLN